MVQYRYLFNNSAPLPSVDILMQQHDGGQLPAVQKLNRRKKYDTGFQQSINQSNQHQLFRHAS